MTTTPSASRLSPRPLALIISLSFAAGFTVPFCLQPLLPAADPGFSYVAIAASLIVNLGCLAAALACLPDANSGRAAHLLAWVKMLAVCDFSHAGLWAAPVHHESIRVFAALAMLSSAQAAALLAVHAVLARFFSPAARAPKTPGEILLVVLVTALFVAAASRPGLAIGAAVLIALISAWFSGASARTPKTICALLLTVLTCALFWTREPIQRLSRAGGNGAIYGSYFADGVVKLSPPAAVAATWYEDSDGARAPDSPTSRRFDLVHAPLTYGVWIGSYQAVASPDILPSGGGDFYNKREFAPGVALILLLWALPLMALCDVLEFAERRFRRDKDIEATVIV